MHYEGDIIRPPSEAGSIILQATVGCSHNRCTFCGAYRDRRFRIKDEALVRADIEFAATYCQRQKTLFLADGNALAIPQQQLVYLLTLIKNRLPQVRRVSLYANARDILSRSLAELVQLKALGLKRIYMGLETGHQDTLRAIGKGADAAEMIQAGRLARQAGLFLSVTVLLGSAGTELSQDHARATASVLNRMRPKQIAVLTLMLLDNTPLAKRSLAGAFSMPDLDTLCNELRTLLVELDGNRVQLQANHPSNYLELDGRLPKDKIKMISMVDSVLDGSAKARPDYLRAL